MKIHVLQGEHTIGGSIIEITNNRDTVRIILDVGKVMSLGKKDEDEVPIGEGLDRLFEKKNEKKAYYNAVFISHTHPDHIGWAHKVRADIPIYMDPESYDNLKNWTYEEHWKDFKIERNEETDAAWKRSQQEMSGMADESKGTISVGSGVIKVKPYRCDHTGFPCYMFLITCEEDKNEHAGDGGRILYTGDFRSHGYEDFEGLLARLPKNIDTLICEGTSLTSNISYPGKTEKEISCSIEKEILDNPHKNVFVLMSGMNYARYSSINEAIKKVRKQTNQEIYWGLESRTYNLLKEDEDNDNDTFKLAIPWSYLYKPYLWPYIIDFGNKTDEDEECLEEIIQNSEGVQTIGAIRNSSMYRNAFENCAKKLQQHLPNPGSNGVILYSMWSGYRKYDYRMKELLQNAEACGYEIKTTGFHTGGHAHRIALAELIARVKPRKIRFVHTDADEKVLAHPRTLENIRGTKDDRTTSEILWDYFLEDPMEWNAKPWQKQLHLSYEFPEDLKDFQLDNTSMSELLGELYLFLKSKLFTADDHSAGIHLIGANLDKWVEVQGLIHQNDEKNQSSNYDGVVSYCIMPDVHYRDGTVFPEEDPDHHKIQRNRQAHMEWGTNRIVIYPEEMQSFFSELSADNQCFPLDRQAYLEIMIIREMAGFMTHYYIKGRIDYGEKGFHKSPACY